MTNWPSLPTEQELADMLHELYTAWEAERYLKTVKALLDQRFMHPPPPVGVGTLLKPSEVMAVVRQVLEKSIHDPLH